MEHIDLTPEGLKTKEGIDAVNACMRQLEEINTECALHLESLLTLGEEPGEEARRLLGRRSDAYKALIQALGGR